jgi:hypothetical protein
MTAEPWEYAIDLLEQAEHQVLHVGDEMAELTAALLAVVRAAEEATDSWIMFCARGHETAGHIDRAWTLHAEAVRRCLVLPDLLGRAIASIEAAVAEDRR